MHSNDKMANDRAELCLLLLLFSSLSVIFFESEGVHVTENIQSGFFTFSKLMLNFLLEAKEQIRTTASALSGTITEALLNLVTFLVALKETILQEELCISTLHWLYHNSAQIILYGAIIYLVYNIRKESGINSKLMKDLRIISNTVGHVGWQVDAHSSEMKAIRNRLIKNEEERIPSIIGKLQTLSDLKEKQQNINKKWNDEIKIWKPRVEEQINSLTILNQKLYGCPDTEIFRKIRTVGWNAGKKIETVKEMLHDRIEEARLVLDETSRLLDIKGLPFKVNYDMEYEFQ